MRRVVEALAFALVESLGWTIFVLLVVLAFVGLREWGSQ